MSGVPYQAYKSKRHSRTLSNSRPASVLSTSSNRPDSILVPSPSQTYQSTTTVTTPTSPFSPPDHSTPNGKHHQHHVSQSSQDMSDLAPWNKPKPILSPEPSPSGPTSPTRLNPSSSEYTIRPAAAANDDADSLPSTPQRPSSPVHHTNGNTPSLPSSPASKPTPIASDTQPEPSSSSSKAPALAPRRASTFRHVPIRNVSSPAAPSPLRPGAAHTRSSSTTTASPRNLDQGPPTLPRSRLSTSVIPTPPSLTSSPSSSHSASASASVTARPSPITAPSPSTSPAPPWVTRSTTPGTKPSTSLESTAASATPQPQSRRAAAPYRPGFQPRGVVRPLTDDFLSLRRARRDVGRVERTRLERRLEKIVALHFGPGAGAGEKVKDEKIGTGGRPRQVRRASSIWDLDLRNVDPGSLWKSVVQREPAPGSKADIRAMEQAITPWQKDADASQCPICTTAFHPITNRKHHCRLCGKIVCSLPVRRPQRPALCSVLFVADPENGRIEEVGEGVDYGVRKRTMSAASVNGNGNAMRVEAAADDKFLRGVRICRDCRPVLLRQQHAQEASQTPTFSRLYAVLTELEREIEDALPAFQELVLALASHDHDQQQRERPSAEATAARRRLVDAFAQYDAVAKRIRKLPTPGPGSSQDRVQGAILARANGFLQKHMVPLQAIPSTKKTRSSASSPSSSSPSPEEPDAEIIDADSMAAHALQPLLEQEALLETFVQEAKAHRKFEDVRTLKANLVEVRAEIDGIMANARAGAAGVGGKA